MRFFPPFPAAAVLAASLFATGAAAETPSAPCRVEAAPAVRVSGTVSDVSRARVAAAVVRLRCGGFERQTQSGLDGAWAMEVPPARYETLVEAPGFAPLSGEMTVPSGSAPTRDFELALAGVEANLTVTGEARYAVRNTTLATKTETPLLEIPQAISVVDRQLLDDQQVQTLEEALVNASGVTTGGYYQDWDYYRIRGFDASFTTHIDGLRGGNGMGEETFGLERVEVLKGPTSMLYGYSTPGGFVNLQTKRPRPEAFGEMQMTFSSYNSYEPAGDVGGSLDGAKTIFGRVSALYKSNDTFVDDTNRQRLFVAPALTWQIAPSTEVTLLTRYRRDTGEMAFPLPADGTVLPNPNGEIPVSRYLGEPGRSNDVTEWNAYGGYALTHQPSSSLTLRQNFRYNWQQAHWNKVLYSAFLDADQRTLYRYPYDYDEDGQQLDVDTSALWKTSTGSIDHEILGGVEYYQQSWDYASQEIDYDDPSQYMAIDVFDPVYGAAFPELANRYPGFQRNHTVGVYVQDQARLAANWTATVGGRFDWADASDDAGPAYDDTKFSPRIGTTWQFVPGYSAYASYSQSFNPQYGRVFDGTDNGVIVPPETGDQWEVGVKAATTSGRLSGTVSVYRLTRKNVTTPDPDHPNFVLTTGAQRSSGVEVEGAARLAPGWNLTANYTYIDAFVTEDQDIPVGTRLQGVPLQGFGGWTSYEIQNGPLHGLGFGVGGHYYTDQSGDLYDTFALPAYGLLEASVSYQLGPIALQLNVNNILDARYFVGSYDSLYVLPGSPRAVRARVAWSF